MRPDLPPPERPPIPAGGNTAPPEIGAATGWLALVQKHGLATVLTVVLVGFLLYQTVTANALANQRLLALEALQTRTVYLIERQCALLEALLQRIP